MIRIDPAHLAKITGARRREDLHVIVQGAIELEFSTIPPYLTAMMSLPVNQNRVIWAILHSVVIEEMLHMAIMCNLLNALGGSPAIDTNSFVPHYPSALPLSIDSALEVGLEAFSIGLVQNIFMGIEQPHHPLVLGALAAAPGYNTIGDFYRALKGKILELGDHALRARNQVTAPEWYGPARLFPLVSAACAAKAIDIIVEEGEGTRSSPLGGVHEIAHYYRFEQIVKGRFLMADATGGYEFTGAAIPFDAAGVYPLTKNQYLRDVEPDSQGYLRASQFAYSFSKLLAVLHRTFNGTAGDFNNAISLMFELKLNGQKLCGEPVLKAGQPTGLTYGPCFERIAQEGYR